MRNVTTQLKIGLALLMMLAACPLRAEPVRIQLNWVAGADHAPLYYALQQGWFAARNVDLQVTPGGGSAFTLAALGRGEFDMGIADLLTVMRGPAGAQSVIAVMNLFVNAPHSFYWLKDSGIHGLADFPGRRLGTLKDDPARRLWRALAARTGVDADSVTWVDMAHSMKVEALAAGRIDVATNAFFHNHAAYEEAFGARLVELRWRTLGFNPSSNAIIARTEFLAAHAGAVTAVVQVMQRAVSVCLRDPDPCLRALLDANPHLDAANTRRNWLLVEELLRAPDADTTVGVFDRQRLQADQAMLVEYFGIKASDPWDSIASNAWIAPAITFSNASPATTR